MIADNIARLKKQIPPEVTIIAVSKNRSTEEIQQVISCGITDIGENRVQEAISKFKVISQKSEVKMHLVGHLQTNKAREAVKIFDLIHSVDSLRLAVEIDKQAAKINKIQDVLIEVNTSGEQSKFGVKPDGLEALIKEAVALKNIKINGLMTVAPIMDNPEKTRPYFRILKELLDKINNLKLLTSDLRLLSMGMTDDYQIAIEEGANMVRLGRAIFEG